MAKKKANKKVYLLVYTDYFDNTYYNGVYSSEEEARKHSNGYWIIEFELDKESRGVSV